MTDYYIKEKVKLSLKLYHFRHLPREDVQSMIKIFNDFLNVTLKEVKNDLIKTFDQSKSRDIKLVFINYENPLSIINTEKKCFALYRELEIFLDPISYQIGLKTIRDSSGKCFEKPVFGVHIPLDKQLKCFFNIPGLLKVVLNYETQLIKEFNETGIVSNILQTELWQKYKRKYQNRILIPIYLFLDDFTTGNALGSHAESTKLGAVYISFPSLPVHLKNKISNTFVASIFRASDRDNFGNDKVFSEVIRDINKLSDVGITVNIDNTDTKIYFACTLLLGDNLGLNQICGFSCSSGKYYCRRCRMPAQLCQITTRENKDFLRNKQNYAEDLKNLSCGVKERCIFNDIRDFHITENLSIDIMHDVFEGTGQYIIVNVLNHLIYVDKILDLATLNRRIETFNYGSLEDTNKPRPFTESDCKNNDTHLTKTVVWKQSAAEGLCLMRYLGLMIGDIIPRNNKCWTIYRLLRKKIGIITAPSLQSADIERLADIIDLQTTQFIENFKNAMYKAHNETHYPEIIRINGPPIHFWSMPFERKHSDLKLVAVNTKCTKNLPQTIAIRNQLEMSYMKLHCEQVEEYFTLGSIVSQNADCELKKLNSNIRGQLDSKSFSYIILYGKKISQGSVLVLRVHDLPLFGLVQKIFKIKGKVYFLVEKLITNYFDDFFHAYDVNKLSDEVCAVEGLELIRMELLPNYEPCLLVKNCSGLFVSCRYDL